MAGEITGREFKQSRTRRLLTGLSLLAAAGWFVWACLTGADVQVRGWDFRETHFRIAGMVVATAPVTVGVEYLVRLALDVADMVVSSEGLVMRRLFFQRPRSLRWAEVTSIREGSVSYGFSSSSLLYVKGPDKAITVYLDRYEEPANEVVRTIVDACMQAAAPGLEVTVTIPPTTAVQDTPSAREVRQAAGAFAEGSIDIRELWDVFHSNIVGLVATGPLEGEYRHLFLGLQAWEQAEGTHRDAAREQTRAAARRLADAP